jgi:hypothetical protein
MISSVAKTKMDNHNWPDAEVARNSYMQMHGEIHTRSGIRN